MNRIPFLSFRFHSFLAKRYTGTNHKNSKNQNGYSYLFHFRPSFRKQLMRCSGTARYEPSLAAARSNKIYIIFSILKSSKTPCCSLISDLFWHEHCLVRRSLLPIDVIFVHSAEHEEESVHRLLDKRRARPVREDQAEDLQ